MENKKNLLRKLAVFTTEVPTIHKGTTGYGYTYADLSQIFEVIKPHLKKCGLSFYQLIDEGCLVTSVFDAESGEEISSRITIPTEIAFKGMNELQALGSSITYLRRYSISAMLSLVTDKDIDGAGEQQPKKSPAKIDIKTLPPLTDERHLKAITAVIEGATTLDAINKRYALTGQQIKEFHEAEISFKNK